MAQLKAQVMELKDMISNIVNTKSVIDDVEEIERCEDDNELMALEKRVSEDIAEYKKLVIECIECIFNPDVRFKHFFNCISNPNKWLVLK